MKAAAALIALLAALLLPACGNDSDDEEEEKTTPTAAAINEKLEGTYTTTISSDLSTPKVPAGRWTLVLVDETYVLTDPAGRLLAGAVFELSTGQVRFGNNPECVEQAEGPGLYLADLRGDRLILRGVKDPCADRVATLTAAPWDRVAGGSE